MIKAFLERLKQGRRTIPFPGSEARLPDRFRGRPALDPSRCVPECRRCLEACPTGALARSTGGVRLDLGRCLFCPECAAACPSGALRFTTDHRLAARRREDLVTAGDETRLAG